MQNENRTAEKIRSRLEVLVRKNKDLKNAVLLIHSDKHGFHWKFAAGTTGPENSPISPDNPFHIASIGKTFTSILIARLYEKGRLDYSDPVSQYLSPEMLAGLFVYGDVDYSRDVRIRHLLNHTSGIADYFEDKPFKGKPMKELVVEDPGRFWRPEETIDYTRHNQRAVASPGKRFIRWCRSCLPARRRPTSFDFSRITKWSWCGAGGVWAAGRRSLSEVLHHPSSLREICLYRLGALERGLDLRKMTFSPLDS